MGELEVWNIADCSPKALPIWSNLPDKDGIYWINLRNGNVTFLAVVYKYNKKVDPDCPSFLGEGYQIDDILMECLDDNGIWVSTHELLTKLNFYFSKPEKPVFPT